MPDDYLDFRSDTVTRPTPPMRAAMAEAAVGDDVFAEDPTVNRLQERVAEMLGKEAAIFVASGTMSNLVGVRLHCKPGDEMICEAGCHIYNYEQAGYAQLSGVALRPVEGDYGVMQAEQLKDLVRPLDAHQVRTRLVSLENTHNRGGGRILPYETVEAVCDWARQAGLGTHLDGARLFNAAVATGIPAARWARHFDTVTVCFSKGLGAPVGSALVGPRDLMAEAVRHRKVLGGGMRQAGVIAAGALYARQRPTPGRRNPPHRRSPARPRPGRHQHGLLPRRSGMGHRAGVLRPAPRAGLADAPHRPDQDPGRDALGRRRRRRRPGDRDHPGRCATCWVKRDATRITRSAACGFAGGSG